MNATRGNLLNDVLGKTQQLLVPIYQRQYSWRTEQCKELWHDILQVGESDNTNHHFMGFVVLKENPPPYSPVPKLIVIDGQQRIATVMLLLEAFARQIEHKKLSVSPEKIRNIYLQNQYEPYDHKHRMVLSEADAGSLKAVIDGNDHGFSLHIGENFSWFRSNLSNLSDDKLEILWRGLRKLSIIEMKLDDDDNPQRIFETINSTGLDLQGYDKIRNYILMGLDSDRQNFLYREYWRAMERTFEKNFEKHFDNFVRYYLVMRLEKLLRAAKDVYKPFKELPSCTYEDKEGLLAEMRKYATYFSRIVLYAEQDQELARAFQDVQTLKVDVSYPLLLHLYGDYADSRLSKNKFIEIIHLVESYVFRRSVCGLSSSDTRSSILEMLKNYKTGGIQQMKNGLHNLGTNRMFPQDHTFKYFFPFYQKNLNYWPARLENHFRDVPLPDDYTMEHIMPQRLSAKWHHSLGRDWQKTHEKCLNVPGNITLTRHNSGLSNLTYPEKYHKPKVGYKHVKLKLNESLKDVGMWNEDAIEARSIELAELAVACWPYL